MRRNYAPQTKILERRSNIRERIFKALFTYVSTRFGPRSFEKCFENQPSADGPATAVENTFPNVGSAFQNLRLVSIHTWVRPFVSTFQTPSYSIWDKSDGSVEHHAPVEKQHYVACVPGRVKGRRIGPC